MTHGFSAARRAKLLRGLLLGVVSYLGAGFVVLVVLALLPRSVQSLVTEAVLGWVVLGGAATICAVVVRRTRRMSRQG